MCVYVAFEKSRALTSVAAYSSVISLIYEVTIGAYLTNNQPLL